MTGVFRGDKKNPVIQRRLDFWLISSSLQEDVDNVDIIPAIKSPGSLSNHIVYLRNRRRTSWAFLLEVQCKLN